MKLPAILTRWLERRAHAASFGTLSRMIRGPSGELYMRRFYLLGAPSMSDGTSPFDERGSPREGTVWPRLPLGVYLHCVHASDPDGELHSHPWRWALSLVLSGGYREEVLGTDGRVFVREREPGSIALLRDSTFHRVGLPGRASWSLFVVGPRSKSWGFLDPATGTFTHWKDRLRPVETDARPYAVSYSSSTVPESYRCAGCAARGCKLWRLYQTFLHHQELLCCDCAGARQGVDVGSIDEWGMVPWDKVTRTWGDRTRRTDTIAWMVPAVPTEEGETFWGYCSTPQDGYEWWRRLPTREVTR